MHLLKRLYTLSIDFFKTEDISTNIIFKQFDYNGNEIGMQLNYSGEPINLQNYDEIVAVFKDAKGNIILDKNNTPVVSLCKIEKQSIGIILLPIPNEILKSYGKVQTEIIIMSNSIQKKLTSQLFTFEIKQSITDVSFDDQNNHPICGETLCGESICGGTTKSANEEDEIKIETSLSKDFLDRFSNK